MQAEQAAEISLGPEEQAYLSWIIQADSAMACRLALRLEVKGMALATATIAMCFLPAIQVEPLCYIPEPHPCMAST